MKDFIIKFSRPSADSLQEYNRKEKYNILKGNSIEQRKQIKEFIQNNNLDEEVEAIGSATVFNFLCITCSERVANKLKEVEGILTIGPGNEFQVDLLSDVYAVDLHF